MKRIALITIVFALANCGFAAAPVEGVRIEKDVDYLGADRKEKADLYLPAEVPKGQRCPGVVIIHGGGWVAGDKGAAREINVGTTLAQHGYVGMSINYLLAKTNETRVVWPQNLHDCKTAVRWLRKNTERLRLDPDHIGVIGGSAGGHLAAMVAVTSPESGLDPAGPYGEYSCRVQAAVDLYGPTLWFATRDLPMFRKKRSEAPEQYRLATPMTHASKNNPPILILHGTADGTVPVADSEAFAAALKKAGAEHQLVIVEGGPHSFHLQPKQQDLRPLVLGFFDKHLKKSQ
jgi:acetyl esterase/lipase